MLAPFRLQFRRPYRQRLVYAVRDRKERARDVLAPGRTNHDSHLQYAQLPKAGVVLSGRLCRDQLMRRLGVKAAPSQAVISDVDLYYKGQHHDSVNNTDFDLYVVDNAIEPAAAFDMYWGAVNCSDIHKLNWFDCHFPDGHFVKELGCNTGHALGGCISNTGAVAMGGLSQHAFGRGLLEGKG